MLLPLLISLHIGDQAQLAYDKAVLITVGAGGPPWFATHRKGQGFRAREGFLLVVLVRTLPLHLPDPSFADAYFEAMFGLATTGATVLSGWTTCRPPPLGVGGRQMHKAETPGP
ncbi:MAG: hypothetical protein MUC79_07945 [Thiobacillaceae bacterium]|jgi:trk system potassium uptake protein TrkH|nr:hypothetical protein [Thiobacillaceae bacterium]